MVGVCEIDAQREAGLGAHRLPGGIDADAFHHQEVDQRAAIADRLACDAVPPPRTETGKSCSRTKFSAADRTPGTLGARSISAL